MTMNFTDPNYGMNSKGTNQRDNGYRCLKQIFCVQL